MCDTNLAILVHEKLIIKPVTVQICKKGTITLGGSQRQRSPYQYRRTSMSYGQKPDCPPGMGRL
jgi:predicted metal-binding protein